MKNARNLVSYLLLFCSCSVAAQQRAQSVWSVQAAPILCKTTIIDRQFSAASFSGILPGAALALSYTNGKTSQQLDLAFTSGTLKTRTHPEYTVTQKRICADYTSLYRIGAAGAYPFTLELGGAADFFYAARTFNDLINDNSPFDLAVSLGAAGRLGLSLEELLPGLSLSERVSLPLISYISQNGADHHVAGPGGFLRLTNFLSVGQALTVRQQLSLTYSWDYYHIKGWRETREADHRLSLNYRLIL